MIPAAVVNHVRICLRLSPQEMPAFDPMRTLQRYQTAIRDHLQLKPAYSREARTVPVRKVFEAAQVMVNPADFINVAVDHLRLEQCELPSFSMLDRLVNRVRTLVHRRVFAQVMRKLGPPEVARLDELLKCRAALINENCIIIVARHNRSFSLDSICGNAHCVPVSFCCDMPRQSLSPDNRF